MKITVVIPNWNGAELLGACLKSLEEQTFSIQIVVVDNGSVDESVKIIEEQFPKVALIKLPKNTGFTGGVNAGIEHALKNDADAVALFNNDAVADKNWIKYLVAALENDSRVGVVTGKLMRMGSDFLDSTGQSYSVWGEPFPRGRDQKDEGQFDSQTRIFGATGGATVYRAAVFQEVGIFDQRFFAYYEDDDLSFRARLAGWEVIYVPTALAYHHGSATASKLGSFTRYHATKNIAMVYLKNMPGWLFWKYLPLFTLWMLRLAITNTFRGGGVAYVRGIGRLILNLPGILKDRRFIQKNRKVSTEDIDHLLFRSIPSRLTTGHQGHYK